MKKAEMIAGQSRRLLANGLASRLSMRLTMSMATPRPTRRSSIMQELSWQAMTREYPAPYVVAGWLPPEDAAAGLGQGRRALLGRLARALPLSGDYALAEMIERDGAYIQCGLALASDAADLAEAVGAAVAGSASPRARHWRFRFDEAAAAAIESALARRVPSETLLHAANRQPSHETPR